MRNWAYEVKNCIKLFTERQQAEVVELNIQPDHVHALVMVPPKVSIFDFVGTVKGRTAIRVLNSHKILKSNPLIGVPKAGPSGVGFYTYSYLRMP